MIQLAIIIVAILILIYMFFIEEGEEPTVVPPTNPYGTRGFCSKGDPWDMPIDIEDILTTKECKKIIKMAKDKFAQSGVVGSHGPSNVRTSETAWLPKSDPIVLNVLQKASELSGVPIENCEEMQVVRYKPGQYYRPHHDSCCDPDPSCVEFEKNGGQRIGTLLIYLNNDFEDGHTEFPNLKSKFRSKAGSGVFFRPMDKSGAQCHPLALHGGMPPKNGTKYVCNIWVRESPTSKLMS